MLRMFHIAQIDQRLFQITDIAGTHCFLVIGERKTALLDTGVGCGSLRGQVNRLTELPVEVFITHGHVDHAMGAGEFENVWMSPLDEAVYREHSGTEIRLEYIRGSARIGGLSQVGEITADQLQPVKPFEQFRPLAPGDIVDLGGITLEIHEGAGHTPGCVTVLIPELRTLLLGDACNQFTYLFDKSCSTVTEYREMLLRLDRAVRGRYDRVLVCHGPNCFAPEGLLDSVVAVCDDILRGDTDNVPFQGFHGEPVAIAKAMDTATFSRVDGGIGNIVYDPKRT